MTASHLLACPSCNRHVRVSEHACPFCGTALAESFRQSPAPRGPRARLGRAALYAFGASALTLATACSSSDPSPSTQDSGTDANYGADAAYGGPPQDGGEDALFAPDAAYGGPPVDASDDGTVNAAYGGPPQDSGAD